MSPNRILAGSTGRAAIAQNIPKELRDLDQWLVWRLEERDGKKTKVPYDAKTGRKGKSNDPATWASFDAALQAYEAGGYSGVGFAFREGDRLSGADLDHVIDTETGEVQQLALEILERFKGSYAEVSPSGTGLRIFVFGEPTRCGKGTEVKAVELYNHSSPRFLTVTGLHWQGSSPAVTPQQDALDWLHATYFKPKAKPKSNGKTAPDGHYAPTGGDDALIERALKAKNGGKLRALLAGNSEGYPSQSEADAALCSILAFWTQDPAQIDRIVRSSGLMRDKWDTKHHADGRTYGEATIDNALANVGRTYADTLRERSERTSAKAQRPDEPAGEEGKDNSWPRAEWRPKSITEEGDTDMGNACRIFDRNGRDLLFLREVGWHTWNGNRWAFDEAGAKRGADELPRLVLTDAADALKRAAAESDQRRRDEFSAKAKTLQSWAKKCEKAATIEAALQMLERRLIVEPTEADADPFLLAVVNGTLDLRIGQLRRSIRGEFITKGSSIAFDETATCPTFEAFLARIFRTHPEVIPFLQRAIGYTLTGDTREQCVFIAHGNGANGKSTLVTVLEQLLGDYAKQAAPDLLLAKTGDRHPTEIADLRGARLVATVETGEGRRMAESLLKQMSGGDRLKGRYMRRDFFDFLPTFKVWLATNHKPAIRGTDLGIWRRIRLVPFVEVIGDDEKDPSLPAKLKAELPGILAWAVRGCLAWQKNGLQPPDVVTNATAAYRAENDILAAFFDECCLIDNRAESTAASLYKAYADWCERNGERTETQTSFGKRLTERGFERSKSGVKKYRGIGLLANFRDSWDGWDSKSSSSEKNDFMRDKPENESELSQPSQRADNFEEFH